MVKWRFLRFYDNKIMGNNSTELNNYRDLNKNTFRREQNLFPSSQILIQVFQNNRQHIELNSFY